MEYLEAIQPYLIQIQRPTDRLDQEAFDQALLKLEPVVDRMLKGNMNELLHFLYRLDVSEQKVKHIFFGHHQDRVSRLLAEAILQREIVRRIFRLKYSG